MTREFVGAATSSGEYQLSAVYSRNEDQEKDFASKYPNAKSVIASTNLVEFFQIV